jgi:glycosyltransferase involved in cell wall biosynthesis
VTISIPPASDAVESEANLATSPQQQRPRLGAVIPAYNRERTIERSIESALEQSTPANQVVVVDDGSTDSTVERARQFGGQITLLEQKNQGASVARNRGVDALDCDWIAFLDSDDYWPSDYVERMSDAISATAGAADVYFADTYFRDAETPYALWERANFSIDGPFRVVDDATGWVMMPLQPFAVPASVITCSSCWASVGRSVPFRTSA